MEWIIEPYATPGEGSCSSKCTAKVGCIAHNCNGKISCNIQCIIRINTK